MQLHTPARILIIKSELRKDLSSCFLILVFFFFFTAIPFISGVCLLYLPTVYIPSQALSSPLYQKREWVCAYSVLKSCLTLCDPVDCSPPTRLPCPWDFPGKNAGVGCLSSFRGPSWPRDCTWIPCISGWVLQHWGTWGHKAESAVVQTLQVQTDWFWNLYGREKKLTWRKQFWKRSLKYEESYCSNLRLK